MINVKVNWPEDMEALEVLAAETLAKILVRKLQPDEIEQLTRILQNDEIPIRW